MDIAFGQICKTNLGVDGDPLRAPGERNAYEGNVDLDSGTAGMTT